MLLENIDHDKQVLFEEHMADGLSVRTPLIISWHCVEGAYQEAGSKDAVLHRSLLNDFAAPSNVNVLNDVGVHDKGGQDAAVVYSDHWVLLCIKLGFIRGPVFLVQEFKGECETCRLNVALQNSTSSLCCDMS